MKKLIGLLIVCSLVITVLAFYFFYYFPNFEFYVNYEVYANSRVYFNSKMFEMFRIISQSMLSGMITFIGLFITIYFQDYQNKKEERLKLCPSIIIKSLHVFTISEKNFISSYGKVICLCNKDNIRVAECIVHNCRSNWALNVYVGNGSEKIFLGNFQENIELSLNFALNEKNDCMFFYFEDIYGISYKQKICYIYEENEINGKDEIHIKFISSQPERRKK